MGDRCVYFYLECGQIISLVKNIGLIVIVPNQTDFLRMQCMRIGYSDDCEWKYMTTSTPDMQKYFTQRAIYIGHRTCVVGGSGLSVCVPTDPSILTCCFLDRCYMTRHQGFKPVPAFASGRGSGTGVLLLSCLFNRTVWWTSSIFIGIRRNEQ